ncbi:hypothetical protein Tco_0295589 [Tanacetum coccineum]
MKDLGLNTYNHDIPLSCREIPSFDELEPQPQPLSNCPSLDISLGDERGHEPPIKPHSPDSFRMKEVDNLTKHTPPSPHEVSPNLKDVYCYYHSCIDDPKKYYRFKPGLLGQSGSLGVEFLNLEMIKDDWELESKEVSFLGEGLNLPNLEEIHVTRTQFGKKQDKIAALHEVSFKECVQCLETASGFVVTPSEPTSDGVKIYVTASFLLTSMENENPIHTLRDYSRPRHEGYQNTIELPDGNNVVPLQSGTIRLLQSGSSFHGLRSEDPNQHLKDFLKLMDSLNLDVANRKRTRYMAAHMERMKRFEEAIFKQREEINGKMAEMFGLLKELTTSRTPEKKEKNTENNKAVDQNFIELSELNTLKPEEVVNVKKEVENRTDNEEIRSMRDEITGEGIDELAEMPTSQPIGYYLNHEINKKIIEGLICNQRYNDSLLATRLGKMDHETYNSLHVGPMYSAILKKKITKKENMEGNFVIPCNAGGLKYMDALVDQGSYVTFNEEKPMIS